MQALERSDWTETISPWWFPSKATPGALFISFFFLPYNALNQPRHDIYPLLE